MPVSLLVGDAETFDETKNKEVRNVIVVYHRYKKFFKLAILKLTQVILN